MHAKRRDPRSSMSRERVAVRVDELEIGMYVAELDRPWLETPFLFQGFLIESEEVVSQLKKYCTYVYIDAERADHTITKPLGLGGPPGRTHEARVVPSSSANAATDSLAKNSTEADSARTDDTELLKAELVQARDAHATAERAIALLLDRIQSGEEIDILSLQQDFDPMIDSILRNDDAMSWLIRMKKKNDYVYDHSLASAIWAVIFGKHLGLNKDELQVLGTGAVFMDVGKTKLPEELLTKRALTNSELEVVRRHVDWGVEIINRINGVDRRVVEMVAGHHERYNGTGYPNQLSGSDIPVFARIAGIVDAYDAMTTLRPYAEPLSTYDAMRQLNRLAGVEFAEEVVEQFVQAVGVFPVGTLVELNTGEVGVVIAQNRVRRLRPKIMLLLDRDKTPLQHFRAIDLRNELADAEGVRSLWIERGLAPGDFGLDPSEFYL